MDDDLGSIVPGEYMFDGDKLTIPAEHVALVSSGMFVALGSAAEEVANLARLADRETKDVRPRWITALDCLDGARSLLGVLGWDLDDDDAEDDEAGDVEIDLRVHRDLLLAALRTQIEAERGHAESLSEDERGAADAHITALSSLIEQAEGRR